jgi:trans-aconitate methyltransferase
MKTVDPNLNNWDEVETLRAESKWGHKIPPYTKDMFDFAIGAGNPEIKSWLDLGCGFGRFLEYLESKVEEPDYVGYDSSVDMINRINKRFPAYSPRVFCRDITKPINNPHSSIICAAVLIHLLIKDQSKILKNVFDKNPKRFVFDINSPSELWLKKGQSHFENHIRGTRNAFRMTWQSHYEMTKQVLAIFKRYRLSIKFYVVQHNRFKVIYRLEK